MIARPSDQGTGRTHQRDATEEKLSLRNTYTPIRGLPYVLSHTYSHDCWHRLPLGQKMPVKNLTRRSPDATKVRIRRPKGGTTEDIFCRQNAYLSPIVCTISPWSKTNQ